MFTNSLLATGMGSLPYLDVEYALEKINKYFPQLPHWPQLPQRNKQELMLELFLFPWVKEKLVTFQFGRGIFSDERNKLDLYVKSLKESQLLPETISPGLYLFVDFITKGYFPDAQGVKGQVTGPNTLCKYNLLANGFPLNHNRAIVEAILKLVQEQITWQIKILKASGLPVIIFIDEPAGLPHFYEPSSEDIQQGLVDIINQSKKQGAIIGIHNCSKPDWYQLTHLPVDIISFDAFSEEIIGKNLQYAIEFLDRGGKIAWGIIPTSGSSWKIIQSKILKYKDLIIKGGLITPSCGLGIVPETTAEQVMELTLKATQEIRRKVEV